MKSEILKQLEFESPDWLLISKLAKEAYAASNQSNQIGFRKGAINIIKAADHSCDEIIKKLIDCFSDKSEYQFFLVGSWRGMTVTKFNKLIPQIKQDIDDKYIVIVTDKDQVFTNSIRAGLEVNDYRSNIKNRWDNKKDKVLNITGSTHKISCNIDELKSHIRNLSLDELLD